MAITEPAIHHAAGNNLSPLVESRVDLGHFFFGGDSLEPRIDPTEPGVDLGFESIEPSVHPVEPLVHLLELPIDFLEPLVDFLKAFFDIPFEPINSPGG